MITLSDGQDLTLGPHVICFLAPSYSSREGRACEETLYPRKENMNLMEIIPLRTALSNILNLTMVVKKFHNYVLFFITIYFVIYFVFLFNITAIL